MLYNKDYIISRKTDFVNRFISLRNIAQKEK